MLDSESVSYFNEVARHPGSVERIDGKSERGSAFWLDQDTLKYDSWSADPGYVGDTRQLPLDQLHRVDIKRSNRGIVLLSGILGLLAGGWIGLEVAKAHDARYMSGLIVFPCAFRGTTLGAGIAVPLTSGRVIFTRPRPGH
jgi:hypothetical protein